MRKRLAISLMIAVLSTACISSGSSSGGGGGLFGPPDQTDEAVALINEANVELKKIKILYNENEEKREDLKKAMTADDPATVRKIADDVVKVINEGSSLVDDAIAKIEQADELNINADFKEYLRLKSETLKKQKEAFEEYRQAARSLRVNYDPKDNEVRERVKAEFKQRSENYQALMEKARDRSSEANELAKEAIKKSNAGR